MNRITIIGLVIFFLNLNSVTGQIHLLKLDFNGNTNDLSGNNNHGNNHGATLTSDRFSNANSAYKFDGIDDYMYIPHSDVFDVDTQNFAISLWINSSKSDSPGMIFQKGDEVSVPQFWLRTNDKVFDKDLVFLTANGVPPSNYSFVDTFDILDSKWHHIIAQRKNDTLEIYCDSKLVSQSYTSQRFLNNQSGIIIGAQNPNIYRNFVHYHFNGCIDDIRLYRTYLSQADVQYIYNEEKCTGYKIDTIYVTDTLIVMDTVITTIQDTITTALQDTVFVTVQDTLKMNIHITSIPPVQISLIKVYPNPTKEIIYISSTNYQDISNYSIKIIDNASRLVYESYFNQQILEINMLDFGVHGLYYLQVFDPNNYLITTKKIILE